MVIIELFRTKKVYIRICRLNEISGQGLGDGNITFADELDFEIKELDIIYNLLI